MTEGYEIYKEFMWYMIAAYTLCCAPLLVGLFQFTKYNNSDAEKAFAGLKLMGLGLLGFFGGVFFMNIIQAVAAEAMK